MTISKNSDFPSLNIKIIKQVSKKSSVKIYSPQSQLVIHIKMKLKVDMIDNYISIKSKIT